MLFSFTIFKIIIFPSTVNLNLKIVHVYEEGIFLTFPYFFLAHRFEDRDLLHNWFEIHYFMFSCHSHSLFYYAYQSQNYARHAFMTWHTGLLFSLAMTQRFAINIIWTISWITFSNLPNSSGLRNCLDLEHSREEPPAGVQGGSLPGRQWNFSHTVCKKTTFKVHI